jgi:hypothetical protein
MSAALAKALIIMDRLFTTNELNLFSKRCLISHKDPDVDQPKGIVQNNDDSHRVTENKE